MSFYSPQSARKPPGRNKRMSVCAMATSPTYAFSPTAQKAQLQPLSQESSTPEPVDLESAEGTVKVRIFPPIAEGSETDAIIRSFNNSAVKEDTEDPFMVVNLGTIRHRLQLWADYLPGIEACVDCSMLAGLGPVTKIMSAAGVNFYARSKNEIKPLKQMDADPTRIVFGQPVKQLSHISYARDNGVGYMVFDSAFELHKIRTNYKDATLLIRLNTAKLEEGQIFKYGRNLISCQDILKTARMLGLKVTGVVADIGAENTASDLKECVAAIRSIFEYSKQNLGFTMSTVLVKYKMVIGEGDFDENFIDTANELNKVFGTSFKMSNGAKADTKVKVIIDPGEYFLKDSTVGCCTVIGTRRIGSKDSRRVCYYINDSIHQMFSYMRLSKGLEYIPKVLMYKAKIKSQKGGVPATIFGYTDDEDDVVCKECLLPGDMAHGDMLAFPGLGPYVKAFTSSLLNCSACYYYCTNEDLPKLMEWLPDATVTDNIMIMNIEKGLSSSSPLSPASSTSKIT